MAQVESKDNVSTTARQPLKAPGTGLVISVKGSRTFYVYVEPNDQATTAYTYRPGAVMPGSDLVKYSLGDQQEVTGITAGANLLATQEEQGRWVPFDVPVGATHAAVWLENATGGTVNIKLSGGR